MKYTDHSTIHRLRGSISGGSDLEAAQKLDPPSLSGRVDEVLTRGPGYDQPDPSYYHPKPMHQSSLLNMLDPEIEIHQPQSSSRASIETTSQYSDDHGKELHQGADQQGPDSETEPERQPRRRSRKLSKWKSFVLDSSMPITRPKAAPNSCGSECAAC